MQVRNNSARLHTIGNVRILPGKTEEVGEEWRISIEDVAELQIMEEAPKRGRPAKVESDE